MIRKLNRFAIQKEGTNQCVLYIYQLKNIIRFVVLCLPVTLGNPYKQHSNLLLSLLANV